MQSSTEESHNKSYYSACSPPPPTAHDRVYKFFIYTSACSNIQRVTRPLTVFAFVFSLVSPLVCQDSTFCRTTYIHAISYSSFMCTNAPNFFLLHCITLQMNQHLSIIRQISDRTHEIYILYTMDNGLNSHNKSTTVTDLWKIVQESSLSKYQCN